MSFLGFDIRRHTPDILRPAWNIIKEKCGTSGSQTVTHAPRSSGTLSLPGHPATWTYFTFFKWSKAAPVYRDLSDKFTVTVDSGPNAEGGRTIEYRYLHPGRHGIEMKIEPDGTLSLDIRASDDRKKYGSGQEMLFSGMKRLEMDGIRVEQIRGRWLNGSDSVNYAEWEKNLSAKMTQEDAAKNTWTDAGQHSLDLPRWRA